MKKRFLPAAVLGCVVLHTLVAGAEAKEAPLPTVAQKPEAPIEVLQQMQSGPLTIRLRRARWADSEEVLMWRNRGKQLTLWFDALLDPAVPLPEGLTPADFIVNVRLINERGQAVQVLPVDPVRSLHRVNLPYVPAKKDWQTNGQSVWRAMPFDPDFDAVKLQVEWLRPGHPFDSKTIPPSLLQAKPEDVAPATRDWLQTLEMQLPARLIEYGATKKITPIAKAESERCNATLFQWWGGLARTVSGESAGTSHAYLKAGLVLQAADASDVALRSPLRIVLRNKAGETLPMTPERNDVARWFAPNGKPLKSNERVVSGSFTMPPSLNEKSRWNLEVRVGEEANPILEIKDLPTPSSAISAAKLSAK